MLPKQVLWLHVGGERLLLGREALGLQGFPLSAVDGDIEDVLESFLHDLAGNAMSLPVLLAVVASAFLAVDWEVGDIATSTSEEIHDAMAIFRALART